MAKRILFLAVLISLSSLSFANTSAEGVIETVIANGLTVFTLEDYSNPLIRIEVNVRAGVSFQNAENAGFFKMLSSLIQKSAKSSFDDVQCNADSTRFILNISPSALSEIFSVLSDDIFNPVFSDGLLKQELATMKREALQNTGNPSYFINSSIDARVFGDEPWKHDTGIYPTLFSKITEENARVLLSEIQENFYTPQNTAIFVSGNIDSAEVVKLVKNAFGHHRSNKRLSFIPLKTATGNTAGANGIDKNTASGNSKKFVIHSKQFSEELTQIVIQYSLLEYDEAEIAANVFNADSSKFKQDVLKMTGLNILAGEYINVASAYKSGCTRVIFQSLMQNSKKSNPVQQSLDFLNATKQNTKISYNEFEQSLSKSNYAYKKQISSSSNFMDTLSQFWAIKPYMDFDGFELPKNYHSSVSYQMQMRNENLKNVNPNTISSIFASETPFVFVILSTKQFEKYKKDFAANGFEEINEKNGSWYTQSLYQNIKSYKDLMKTESQSESVEIDYAKNFYEANKASISQTTLPNGINLFVKENPNATGVTFVISIDGGNLRTANDHGFEEVMINIFATNIMRQIEQKQQKKLIVSDYEIYTETKIDYSRIIIECDIEDFLPILNSCANALILDEISPADADIIVQGRRTQKRLENGSTINQLHSAAINRVLPNSDYTKIFETKKEILENTTYEKILQYYPDLLDARRFSFIVSGDVKADEVKKQVSKVFSVLQNQSKTASSRTNSQNRIASANSGTASRAATTSNFNFPTGKQEKIKLTHTFLTDVSAKDAGPMPEKLIPTKDFFDPVLYCAKSPDFASGDYFVFNAILPYLQNAMNDFSENRNDLFNCKISASKPSSHIPMAIITFSSVGKTSAADNVYKSVLKSLKENLSSPDSSEKTLQKIKDTYIVSEFQDALTNTGSAILMDNAIHEFALQGADIKNGGIQNNRNGESVRGDTDGAAYLEIYMRVNNISSEEVISVLEEYFDFSKLYRLYSADSRK